MLLMAGLMLADKAAGLEDRLRDRRSPPSPGAGSRGAAPADRRGARRGPRVEVRVEVPVIPIEVRQLFTDVAEETEALAHAVASLVPHHQQAG
jgi:cell division protein ZapA